jgi:hypothetical protein
MRLWGHIWGAKELTLYGIKGGESKGENGDHSNRKASPFNERIESLKGAENRSAFMFRKKIINNYH